MIARSPLVLSFVLSLLPAIAGAATVSVPGDFPTIQAAIDGAADGSVVQIAAGHYAEKLTISYVTRTLTLRGDVADPSQVVVDASGTTGAALSVVNCGSNVQIEGITVSGGSGSMTDGGGLFLANSDVVFRNCVFENNSTPHDGGAGFILTSGGLFRDCVFRNNSATRFGGGLMMNVRVTTAFERCQFTGNTAGNGDDVEGWGGAVYSNDSTPTFIGCSFTGNHSKYAAGGLAFVGHFTEPESSILLRDCEIGGNTAVQGRPDLPATDGGGVHIEDNVRVVLDRCRVHDNTSGNGGGLSSYRGTYEVNDSVIEDNHAVPVTPDVAGGYGGGISATSVNTSAPARKPSVVTIRRSVIRNNNAHVGGALLAQGDFLSFSSNRATLTIEDSLLSGNVASGRAGAAFLDRADTTITRTNVLLNSVTALHDAWGGALGLIGGSVTTITDSALCGNSAAELGGAIYADQASTLTITGSHLYGNQAAPGDGLGGGAIAIPGAGGPIPGPVTGSVTDSVIAGNGAGAEIWESDCTPSMWSQVTFTDNVIHPTDKVYFRNCSGFSGTVAAFNNVPGKASGNVNATPNFADFRAAPAVITAAGSSVLSWCVPHGGLSIAPGVGALPDDIGTVDVGPDTPTTYTLSDGSGSRGTQDVAVDCNSLGTPIPATPANGRGRVLAEGVTLAWYPADGASSYDVYLDATDEPSTLVASDLTETSLALPTLQFGTTYRWKVVAKSPACVAPVTGPVFRFTTCNGSVCFADDFSDGDVSDWTVSGKGASSPDAGRMRIKGRKRFQSMAPAGAIGDGTIAMQLALLGGRREVRIVFGYQGTSYRQLVLRAPNKVRLEERSDRRAKRIGLARYQFTDAPFQLAITTAAGQTTVTIDSEAVLSGAFAGPQSGAVGLQVQNTSIVVDDVSIEGQP